MISFVRLRMNMPVRRESSAARSSPKTLSSFGQGQVTESRQVKRSQRISYNTEKQEGKWRYLRAGGLPGAQNWLLVDFSVRSGRPEDPRVHKLYYSIELLQVILYWGALKTRKAIWYQEIVVGQTFPISRHALHLCASE